MIINRKQNKLEVERKSKRDKNKTLRIFKDAPFANSSEAYALRALERLALTACLQSQQSNDLFCLSDTLSIGLQFSLPVPCSCLFYVFDTLFVCFSVCLSVCPQSVYLSKSTEARYKCTSYKAYLPNPP